MWTVAKLKNGTPIPRHYGFGWFHREQKRTPLVEHEGAWQGIETVISRYPDDKLTVVFLTNLESAEPSKFADSVAEMYLSGKVKIVSMQREFVDGAHLRRPRFARSGKM